MVALSPTKLWAVPFQADAHDFVSEGLGIFYKSDFGTFKNIRHLKTIGFKTKIIGTCTDDDIDFDPSPYGYDDADFRKLLSANELHFVNSLVKPDFQRYSYEQNGMLEFKMWMQAWQAAENALVKKLLILEKI